MKEKYVSPVIIDRRFSPKEFDRMVRMFGPKCAAWLVKAKKHSFKQVGGVDFISPRSKEEPLWFRLAMKCLRNRPSFEVKILSHPDRLVYQVRWLRWGGRMYQC